MIFANQILYKQFVGGDVTGLKGISILLKNSRRHIHAGFTKKYQILSSDSHFPKLCKTVLEFWIGYLKEIYRLKEGCVISSER